MACSTFDVTLLCCSRCCCPKMESLFMWRRLRPTKMFFSRDKCLYGAKYATNISSFLSHTDNLIHNLQQSTDNRENWSIKHLFSWNRECTNTIAFISNFAEWPDCHWVAGQIQTLLQWADEGSLTEVSRGMVSQPPLHSIVDSQSAHLLCSNSLKRQSLLIECSWHCQRPHTTCLGACAPVVALDKGSVLDPLFSPSHWLTRFFGWATSVQQSGSNWKLPYLEWCHRLLRRVGNTQQRPTSA